LLQYPTVPITQESFAFCTVAVTNIILLHRVIDTKHQMGLAWCSLRGEQVADV
jgi:hypothetical protein